MTRRILAIGLCASLYGAPIAFAQNGSFTLDAALREARRANGDVIAANRRSDAATAAAPSARFLDAPMLESQIWAWPLTTVNPGRAEMYMFTVEQTVPGAGKRAGRERVATLDAAVSDVEAATRLNAILAEVKQRYLDLYVARATSRLLAEQVPLLESTIDASTLRYAAGHAGQHDTVGSIVELARLRADAVDWLERERLAETRLNALLGRDPAAPVPALADPGIETPAPADAEALAVAHNAEVTVAEKMVQREEAELARVRGDRRPDLIVGGGYMLQPGSAGAWTLNAGLTWPNAPWSRGKLATDIAAQEQRVAAAKATRAAAVLAARSAARQALVRLAAAHERVRLLESTVLPHVEHGLEVARAAYVSERGDYADLIDTQRVLVSTRITLIAARADIARAAADLTLAMGLDQEE